MTRVLAVANPAASSGKTATAVGVASMLVDLGQQVLGVDLDPQAGLTRALGVDADALALSLHDVLVRGVAVAEVMVDSEAGVDLVPASLELSGVEAHLVARAGRETLLRGLLADVAPDYDWVVIDCASTMGLLTLNALAMADVLLVPVREPANRALRVLLESVDEVRRFVNPQLNLLGALPHGVTGVEALPEALPVLPAIPAPPLALNAYRELAKRLRDSA